MRKGKKLTRAQRQLLQKCGYNGNLSDVFYNKQDRDFIYFMTSEGTMFTYSKETNELSNKEDEYE